MDDWGVDVVVAGSQKGFGVPPGIAFVSMSDRAWAYQSGRPRFYFDLGKERKGQLEGKTAWTPAISVIQSLHAALTEINNWSIDAVVKHHGRLAEAARLGVFACNLCIFPKSNPSDALTAIALPKDLDGVKLQKILKQTYGAIFAGGQDELKGRILRLSHLGFTTDFDLLRAIASLEFALRDIGHKFEVGSGVAATLKALAASIEAK